MDSIPAKADASGRTDQSRAHPLIEIEFDSVTGTLGTLIAPKGPIESSSFMDSAMWSSFEIFSSSCPLRLIST